MSSRSLPNSLPGSLPQPDQRVFIVNYDDLDAPMAPSRPVHPRNNYYDPYRSYHGHIINNAGDERLRKRQRIYDEDGQCIGEEISRLSSSSSGHVSTSGSSSSTNNNNNNKTIGRSLNRLRQPRLNAALFYDLTREKNLVADSINTKDDFIRAIHEVKISLCDNVHLRIHMKSYDQDVKDTKMYTMSVYIHNNQLLQVTYSSVFSHVMKVHTCRDIVPGDVKKCITYNLNLITEWDDEFENFELIL